MTDRSKGYAGRYICQRDAGTCRKKHEGKPCPLAERCKGAKETRGQLEWFWPVGMYGKLRIQTEPGWNAKHSARLRQLKWAFVPEVMKAYYSAYQKKNRERVKKSQKACIERKREREKEPELEPDRRDPVIGYGDGARHLRLPCGEDCGNCPLPEGPEGCPYTDEDEDKLMELEYGKDRQQK